MFWLSSMTSGIESSSTLRPCSQASRKLLASIKDSSTKQSLTKIRISAVAWRNHLQYAAASPSEMQPTSAVGVQQGTLLLYDCLNETNLVNLRLPRCHHVFLLVLFLLMFLFVRSLLDDLLREIFKSCNQLPVGYIRK